MTPCLEEPGAANISKASGLLVQARPQHTAGPGCLRVPAVRACCLLPPSELSSSPARPVPSFVVTTFFF